MHKLGCLSKIEENSAASLIVVISRRLKVVVLRKWAAPAQETSSPSMESTSILAEFDKVATFSQFYKAGQCDSPKRIPSISSCFPVTLRNLILKFRKCFNPAMLLYTSGETPPQSCSVREVRFDSPANDWLNVGVNSSLLKCALVNPLNAPEIAEFLIVSRLFLMYIYNKNIR